MKNNREYIKWGLTAFFVVLGGFVSYYVIFHIDSFSLSIRNLFAILMPIIDGFILAYLLTPLVNATERLITTPFFVLIKKEDKKPETLSFYYNYRCVGSVVPVFLFLNRHTPDCQ